MVASVARGALRRAAARPAANCLNEMRTVEQWADERRRRLRVLPQVTEEVEAWNRARAADVLGIAQLVDDRRVDPAKVVGHTQSPR
jgi:hypothetical protein